MAELVIKTGDQLQVQVQPPTVVPLLANQPVCLLGDELPVQLRVPLPYTAPPFVTPGTGTLAIQLLPNNQTTLVKAGKVVLVKGAQFVARFQVQTPAQQPTPAGPIPDPLLLKVWTAQFVTTTTNVTAS
ncbi:MAG: hypothetical protein ACR2N4_15115 [Jatrophihabitans sp.]